MSAITAAAVKSLRDRTGAGMMDCKKALIETDGNEEQAIDLLRQWGSAKAAKRAGREASEGIIELYSHGDGRVGVMLEINSETDFVARSDAFREFAHELTLQIAAMSPQYVSEEDIPAEVLEHETEIARKQALEEGKPENIVDRIAEGRLKKFKDEACLLRQPYIRDDSITIEKLLHEKILSLGENIIIRRFSRWQVGEFMAQ